MNKQIKIKSLTVLFILKNDAWNTRQLYVKEKRLEHFFTLYAKINSNELKS